MTTTKRCPRCDEDRPIAEFYVNKGRSDGLSPLCIMHSQLEENRRAAALRAELLAVLGDRCSRCGFDDARALQVDHVTGGGNLERASGLWSASRKFVEHVKAHPDDYQLLCANCNWIKRIEEKEHVGTRVYERALATEKLSGVGRGNSPSAKAKLRTRLADPVSQSKAAKSQWERMTPEERSESVRQRRLGTKLVDGHWVRPT